MQHAVSAVLFDLDNTLADRDEAFKRWARHFACDQLSLVESVEIENVVSALIVLDADGYTPKDVLFRAIADRFAWQIDDANNQSRVFREQLVGHLPPLDAGATNLLLQLDEARMPWGIVTNGSSLSQRGKIRKLGYELERRATCVVISEEVGLRKPDPAVFRAAAERMGVPLRDVLFVGDHPVSDVAGAASAGMRTAWLCRGRSWPADLVPIVPDLTVDSLDELRWAARGGEGPEHTRPQTRHDHLAPHLS